MSKLHSSFLLITNKSQELYFEPQLFEQQKNVSYKETFATISFQSKVLQPNTVKMKLA